MKLRKGTDVGSDFLTDKTAVPKGCHNDFEVTESLLLSGLTEQGLVWSKVFGE